jgi:hypothetical protein
MSHQNHNYLADLDVLRAILITDFMLFLKSISGGSNTHQEITNLKIVI